MHFPFFQKFLPSPAGRPAEAPIPCEQLEKAYQQLQAGLEADLLHRIQEITPAAFEKFVADLLRRLGYGAAATETAAASRAARSEELIVMKDRLGFSCIYVLAKKWAPDWMVGVSELQRFGRLLAARHGEGLFVTAAPFSQPAKDYAKTHFIRWMDGAKLTEMMIEHNFCVSVVKTLEVKAVDPHAFAAYWRGALPAFRKLRPCCLPRFSAVLR